MEEDPLEAVVKKMKLKKKEKLLVKAKKVKFAGKDGVRMKDDGEDDQQDEDSDDIEGVDSEDEEYDDEEYGDEEEEEEELKEDKAKIEDANVAVKKI